MKRATKLVLVEIAVPVLVIAFIWFATQNSGSFYVPPVQSVLERLFSQWLAFSFLTDVIPSLRRMLTGLGIAIVLGIALGVLIGRSRTTRRIVTPPMEFLRAIPPPALIPFTMLVFGIGDASKIFLIAGVCLFPILLNTIDGVAGIEPTLRDTARIYQIPAAKRLLRVILPAASPQIMAGIRTSLSLSIILMVISEMVASLNGIGMQLVYAQRTYAIADMWAGIILLGVIGYLLNFIFGLIERRLLRWHHGSKKFAE